MEKIKLLQFKILMMACTIIISGIAIISINLPQAEARSTPFIGEITWYGFNFAPRGWAQCDGQLLLISQNDALFALIGTIYGGDGETTFALPDMRGRIPVDDGAGPGLTPKLIGQRAGAETHTLSVQEIPSHTHAGQINVNNEDPPNQDEPAGNFLSKQFRRGYHDNTGTTTTDILAGVGALENTGGSQAHNNMMPYQVLNCNIALTGIFPSRN